MLVTIRSYLPKIKKMLWAAFLVSLPVTNFPYFPAGLGGSRVSVRPLLIYPLFLLILFILPTLWKHKLPKTWLPFFVFFLLALTSSVLPILAGFTSELSEVSVLSRVMRTLVTLILAASIYLIVSVVPLNEEDLHFTLKWLYIGLIVALFWGSLQIVYVLDDGVSFYKIMRNIQRHISISRGLTDRIIGLTQEPSWFAGQIAVLWLPWILSASLTNFTVFKKRWGWITVEKILLVWMFIALVFTLSRGGIMVAAIVVGFGVTFLRPKVDLDKIRSKDLGSIGKIIDYYYNMPSIVRTILTTVIILVVVAGVLFVASKESPYIFRMWDYWLGITKQARQIETKSLSKYFRYIGFGPRMVYWETAFNIFSRYPLFGVGLGNFTFHFLENIPAVQIGYMPELYHTMVPDYSRVITAKNYFARLLAETGLLGTTAFVTFLIVLVGNSVYLWLSNNTQEKFWGIGGLLALVAFLADTFSYDSLAIPNPWIDFGLITAAFSVYIGIRHQRKEI